MADFNPDAIIDIGSFSKTETSKIGVQLIELDGQTFVSIRKFYKKKTDKQYMPAKQGIMIPVEKIGSLRKLLRLAKEQHETPAKPKKKKSKKE